MNWETLWIILAILFAFGWATLFTTIRDMVKHAKEVRDKYLESMKDGTCTDEELKAMLPAFVSFIEDFTKASQMVLNLVYKILPFFKKLRK
jgi:hypothetical protein